MPLFSPSRLAPNIIHAECNAPVTLTAGGAGNLKRALFDSFYDKASAALSGTPLTNALAAIGFTYNAGTGVFTATDEGTWLIATDITPIATPAAQQNRIGIAQAMFGRTMLLDWEAAVLPPMSDFAMTTALFCNAAETFSLDYYAYGVFGDGDLFSYAVLSIIRLQ